MPPEGRITDLAGYLNRKAKEAAEQIRKTLYGAVISRGGLRVQDGGEVVVTTAAGVEMFYLGQLQVGTTTFRGMWLKREDGSFMFYTSIPGTDPSKVFFAWLDRGGTVVVSDDAVSGKGLSRPWLAVPMTALFSMAASTTWSYMNIAAATIASETTLWSGRIPLVSHPRLSIAGLWGQASGSNSATYRLLVNNTEVGTWSTGALENTTKGPFDITSKFDQPGAIVELKVSASGTGQVAAHVAGCWLRQS